MRIAYIALPLLLLAGCKVTKDDQNDTITAEYNQEIAENGFEAATNEAGNIAEDIANDVQDTAAKVGNEADEVQDGNKAN
jgi:hypothetical protein